MYRNKIIISCVIIIIFGIIFLIINFRSSSSAGHYSGMGSPGEEGEMFTRSMNQYFDDLRQNTIKLNNARIYIPELGLSGKFVEGIFENSTSSKNVFRVTYFKHTSDGLDIDFRSPGSILEISKNDFPTTTYIVLFDNNLTSVRASKKIIDAWKITGYTYIESSQLLDKKNLPEGRFDIFFAGPPSAGIVEHHSGSTYKQEYKILGNQFIEYWEKGRQPSGTVLR